MIHYVIWFLVAILYSPVFLQLYRSRWESVDYTHAYFILPISLLIAWSKRKTLVDTFKNSAHTPGLTSNITAFTVILFSLLMFIFGWRWDYLFISTLSLIPLLFGLTAYTYGMAVTKKLSFPILYLLCLVPPPLGILDNLTLPMRYGISVATEAILKVLHYPITREGLLLSIGGHEIFMGQPCSGFRSLITIFSLSLVYVYMTKGGLAKKFILVTSIVPLALLGNLIRVTAVCAATYHLGESAAQKSFHDLSGIVIFVVMIFGLLGVESLLDKTKIGRGLAHGEE